MTKIKPKRDTGDETVKSVLIVSGLLNLNSTSYELSWQELSLACQVVSFVKISLVNQDLEELAASLGPAQSKKRFDSVRLNKSQQELEMLKQVRN